MDLRLEAGEISASAAVIAIEDYDYWKKLNKLADAASGLAQALAARGIINGFPKGLSGGTSDELASGVRSWFRNAGTDEGLFLYWSGHGQREADGLYLIARDSPLSNLDQTNAVQPSFLAKSAASSKARKILIILDACFSGEAIGEVIETIWKVLSNQAPVAGKRRGFAVLASAHALQPVCFSTEAGPHP